LGEKEGVVMGTTLFVKGTTLFTKGTTQNVALCTCRTKKCGSYFEVHFEVVPLVKWVVPVTKRVVPVTKRVVPITTPVSIQHSHVP
jgi:hypothetical protein